MEAKMSKLARGRMQELLLTCLTEQRPPTIDEISPPTPKKIRVTYAAAERTGTGAFDHLDDDTLVEVMSRLHVKQRIVFSGSLCKQFASVAQSGGVFKSVGVGEAQYLDTEEEQNKMMRFVDNWRFLTAGDHITQIEELKLRGVRGRTINLPPARNLQRLSVLKLHNVTAQTVKDVRKSIDAAKLKELELWWTPRKDSTALLAAACNLERLEIGAYPSQRIDMAPIIDAWHKVHNGFPPLRFLQVQCIGVYVTMHDLEKLDLDELYAYGVSERITKGCLPSMRDLHVQCFVSNATANLPPLKTLVASCPALQLLTLVAPSSTPELIVVADAMKAAHPLLTVNLHLYQRA